MAKQLNDFKLWDEVILIDGREGIIVDTSATNENIKSPYYYTVKTYDGDGNETFFKMFYQDMKHK